MSNPAELEKLWPLIKAWGDAVEHNQSGAAELGVLQQEALRNPDAMRNALVEAYGYQRAVLKYTTPAVPESDFSHPAQRCAGIDTLVSLLNL